MADGLRNHEIAAALDANERAMASLGIATHSLFARISAVEAGAGRNTEALGRLERVVNSRMASLELELASLRGAIGTIAQLEAERVDIRKEELRLRREELDIKAAHDEISGQYEVTRLEHKTKQTEAVLATARDGARGVAAFFQTKAGWGVLLLCGMAIAGLMGSDEFADSASNLLALWRGAWRVP